VRVFLDIISGPYTGKVIQVETGMTLRVGRSGKAEVILADDCDLAPVHFAVSCDDKTCNLFDWGSEGGTIQNGKRVYKSTIFNGDKIKAGKTSLIVYVETGVYGVAGNDKKASVSLETPLSRLLQILQGQSEPLYALLDAARDPLVLKLLGDCSVEYQSLYDGDSAKELAEVAPYLVSLSNNSSLLESIVYHGWGNNWGIYLTSVQEFKYIRKHFRAFQFVEDENGDKFYFRFYDPRVLRIFLPSCTEKQAQDFGFPISKFLIEAERPLSLLELGKTANNRKLLQHLTPEGYV